MWQSIVEVDQDIFRWINGLAIGKFKSFWLFVTHIENWFLLYIFFFFLLFKSFKKPVSFIAMTAVPLVVFITLSLTNLVKNGVERLRPNNEPVLMDSIQILLKPGNFSFWSGHSAVSFAVTTFVVLALRSKGMSKWIFLFYIWPTTFALSRIFVGVHYPADITVGMLVGILLGWLCSLIFFKIASRLQHTT
ncbi:MULTISPECIES: phosphatase PAP2 family protein [unclassified Nonlabens]|uniref:phosphatase PAP2 family protein n=1 Tax=unclassified Nonlabens TaxID=2615035 RepID=UPI00386DF625